ncbi:hypothetical protein EDF59_10238 [Novosphingobium sp. ST904]|nr:hypothetical protein EDF59_10238 [Novosphingobium sp. ST904]
MAETKDDGSNSTYGVAYKMWKDVRYTYSQPQNLDEDLEIFIKCRRAVIRGELR